MRDIRPASFDEFVAWYLRRETRKGNRPARLGTPAELRDEMRRCHAGKLRDWFPRAVWRVVELTSLEEILGLVCVDGLETRRNGLLGSPQEANRRILSRVIQNALGTGYFDDCKMAMRDPAEHSQRQQKIEAFRSEWPSLAGEERVVLCDLNAGERRENPGGTYYLHDGFGRLLAAGFLILHEGRKWTPIEAFLALE
jgi:hypothetical protein